MNELTPKISIIIPVYNVGPYIGRCCKSLFSQTYNNIEYVFVNDCTQDNSIDIIKSFLLEDCNKRKNVKIINHTENHGLAMARNTGVSNASGEFITFVDSDDEIPINAIELFVESLYVSPIIPDIVIANHSVNISQTSHSLNKISICNNSELLKNILTKRELSNIWGSLFKADLLKKEKWWDGLDFGEDYATLPRLIYKAKHIIKCKFNSYIYHTDNNNSYMRSIRKKSAEQLYEILNNLKEYFSDSSLLSQEIIIEGKLRAKSHLLQGSCDNNETFEFVCNWFNELPLSGSMLNFKERLILELARKKAYKILRCIIKVRSSLKFIGI